MVLVGALHQSWAAFAFSLAAGQVPCLLSIDHDIYSAVVFIAELLKALVHVAIDSLSLLRTKLPAIFWLSLLQLSGLHRYVTFEIES